MGRRGGGINITVISKKPFFLGPDERGTVETREQSTEAFIPSSTRYQSISPRKREETIIERSKDMYCEIFEDADDSSCKESNVENIYEPEKQLDINARSGSLPEVTTSPNQDAITEDWDKEIQDTLAYNLVLETFKGRSQHQVYFQNQLQNLLYAYPPACQAFTKTANYESAVYSPPTALHCSVPLSCESDIDTAGQFDDADEEGTYVVSS